jgi:hypothetical protein
LRFAFTLPAIRPSRLRARATVGLLLAVFAAPAFAAIEGTVTNGTTGKPAAGDEVVLLDLSQGMSEAAKTKTDASGHYKFDVELTGGMPHLVRASHQGVNYFTMVPPGTNSADVQVYDSAKKVDGLAYNVETAFQTDAGVLQVVQFYGVRNTSSPPRTQNNSDGFEIALPENASIQQSDVQGPGGQPIQTAANPKGNGRYVFDYPLRPGDTTFRVMYTLPYSGQMTFKPTLLHPLEQFAIVTPPGITFQANRAGIFSPQQHQGGVNIQVANNVGMNSDLSYRVSGNGQMPNAPDQGGDQGGGMGGGDQAGQPGRPGGGLGAPIDTPDPLTRYKWPIVLILAVLLLFGGFYIVTHRQPGSAVATGEGAISNEAAAQQATAPIAQDRPTLLLEAMKEELFQLEVDRQQGNISDEEYAKAKQALDATLQRALARSKDARHAGA